MPQLHQLPDILAWKLGLKADRSEVLAFFENANGDELKPKPVLLCLGHSDGWLGAPAHIPTVALNTRVYNSAYTPAILLEMPCIDGMIATIALNASAAETLAARLSRAATAIEKWESCEGENRIGDMTKELLDMFKTEIQEAKDAQKES